MEEADIIGMEVYFPDLINSVVFHEEEMFEYDVDVSLGIIINNQLALIAGNC